jgi:hypothetical protein
MFAGKVPNNTIVETADGDTASLQTNPMNSGDGDDDITVGLPAVAKNRKEFMQQVLQPASGSKGKKNRGAQQAPWWAAMGGAAGGAGGTPGGAKDEAASGDGSSANKQAKRVILSKGGGGRRRSVRK